MKWYYERILLNIMNISGNMYYVGRLRASMDTLLPKEVVTAQAGVEDKEAAKNEEKVMTINTVKAYAADEKEAPSMIFEHHKYIP